jgi:MFS family permease
MNRLHGQARVTYRRECWRAAASGLIESAAGTFLLLIAVRQFEAGATAKALVAGGGSLGFLLSPWVVSVVARMRMNTARAAAMAAAVGAVAFLLMACAPRLPLFVFGSMLAITAYTAAFPLFTQIYQENYPEENRGRLYGITVMIRLASAAAFTELGGRALDRDIANSRALLFSFALAFAFISVLLLSYRSRPLQSLHSQSPSRILALVFQDRLLRRTTMSWFLMGFANLAALPLRIEHLTKSPGGHRFSAAEIAFLVGVVPTAARLLTVPLWGWIFDRVNFILLRIVLNVGLAAGIWLFFLSADVTGIAIASLLYGIASGGGDVSWGLWVTKFAPSERVADYMSVHSFFSGIRGLAAPLLGFHFLRLFSTTEVAAACAVLIVVANVILLRELPLGIRRTSVTPTAL